MVNPKDVNPYDLGEIHNYCEKRRIDDERKKYVNREIEKLKFEYGADHINPYDLGQVARINRIFNTSRELYRKKR